MKKLLLISFFFPPDTTIGSQRPYKLSKYFPEFGWEPIVLTPELSDNSPEGIKIIKTGYIDILSLGKMKLGLDPSRSLHQQLGIKTGKDYSYTTCKSKLIKLTGEIIAFPDEKRGWYKFAVKEASKFLDNCRVDVIISTSSPVTSHLIARYLKRKYGIPWVADLRDLWTQNHFYEKYGLIKFFERRKELETLSDADALITVTPKFVNNLKLLHKNKYVFCVTNGYDPDDFTDSSTQLIDKFTLSYSGTLCGGKRSPSLLFYAVKQLIDENRIDKDSIEIRFFGDKYEWLEDEMNKYGLNGIVKFYGFIPRKKVLEMQKISHVLILLLNNDNKEEDVYPAKVFEYFGAKRPVIAIGGSGSIVSDLLKVTNTGLFAENADFLKNILSKYYCEFKKSGTVAYSSYHNVDNYSYKKITERYSEILNKILYE